MSTDNGLQNRETRGSSGNTCCSDPGCSNSTVNAVAENTISKTNLVSDAECSGDIVTTVDCNGNSELFPVVEHQLETSMTSTIKTGCGSLHSRGNVADSVQHVHAWDVCNSVELGDRLRAESISIVPDDCQCCDEADVRKTYVDSMFYHCDVNQSGNIAVSDVFDYLTNNVDLFGTEENVDILRRFLDPTDINPNLNLKQFRNGMSAWMKSLGVEVSFSSDEDGCITGGGGTSTGENLDGDCADEDESCNSPSSSSDNDRNPGDADNNQLESSPNAVIQSNLFDTSRLSISGTTLFYRMEPVGADSSVMSNSLEASNSCSEEDLLDLQSRLESAQYQNRKLSEELAERMKQLELCDEQLAQHSLQIENLQAIIKSQQAMCDRVAELRHENERLESNIVTIEELRQQLEVDRSKLQLALTESRQEITTLQRQMNQLRCEIDASNELNQQLQNEFDAHLEQRNAMTSLQYETQLNELINQVKELTNECTELLAHNEYLKSEKDQLERRLAETHHVYNPTEWVKFGEVCIDPESDDEVIPVRGVPVGFCETPRAVHSLGSELRLSIMEEPVLPSPLCEKEFEELIRSVGRRPVHSDGTSGRAAGAAVSQLDFSAPEVDCNASDADQVPDLPCWTQRKVMGERPSLVRALVRRDVDDLVRCVKSEDDAALEHSSDGLVGKIMDVVETRNDLEKRCCKQSALIRNLKEHRDAELVSYNERCRKMAADIVAVESSLREQTEQLQVEASKRQRLELVVDFLQSEKPERLDSACGPDELIPLDRSYELLDTSCGSDKSEYLVLSVEKANVRCGMNESRHLLEPGKADIGCGSSYVSQTDIGCGSENSSLGKGGVGCGTDCVNLEMIDKSSGTDSCGLEKMDVGCQSECVNADKIHFECQMDETVPGRVDVSCGSDLWNAEVVDAGCDPDFTRPETERTDVGCGSDVEMWEMLDGEPSDDEGQLSAGLGSSSESSASSVFQEVEKLDAACETDRMEITAGRPTMVDSECSTFQLPMVDVGCGSDTEAFSGDTSDCGRPDKIRSRLLELTTVRDIDGEVGNMLRRLDSFDLKNSSKNEQNHARLQEDEAADHWCLQALKVCFLLLIAGALIVCLLTAFDKSPSPVSLRHLAPPPT